eukprot:TRINITY_DN7554_c1_g1_i3.p1 TRINITY_DN7554_c1_g1~~TRINITY_DN7554_c1_g1_i3.p1  ORF type:complete len:183 (+),score=32.37 TRINITY_DN7554_c1_g1_i3:505-1053(+)
MQGGCGHLGCGRRDNQHTILHFKNTDHPLYVKLNTLEIWCHSCQKWIGEADSHELEIYFTERIRTGLLGLAKKEQEDSELVERRKHERNLRSVKPDDLVRYVINSFWFDRWIRFIIGDLPPPSDPVNNLPLIRDGNLFNFSNTNHYLVSVLQWEYLIRTYGGGPTIRLNYSKSGRLISLDIF